MPWRRERALLPAGVRVSQVSSDGRGAKAADKSGKPALQIAVKEQLQKFKQDFLIKLEAGKWVCVKRMRDPQKCGFAFGFPSTLKSKKGPSKAPKWVRDPRDTCPTGARQRGADWTGIPRGLAEQISM